MNYRDDLKLRSYINGAWNSKLFMQEWKDGMHGSLLPVIHDVNKVVFYREIAQDIALLTEQVSMEQTMAGKTKLIIKIAVEV